MDDFRLDLSRLPDKGFRLDISQLPDMSGWRQDRSAPGLFDRFMSLFDNPAKRIARAQTAMMDAEQYGLAPHIAEDLHDFLRQYESVNPEEKSIRAGMMQAIRRYNDSGGKTDDWIVSSMKRLARFPFRIQAAAGRTLEAFEQSGFSDLLSTAAPGVPTGSVIPQLLGKTLNRWLWDEDGPQVIEALKDGRKENRLSKTIKMLYEPAERRIAELEPVTKPGGFGEVYGSALESWLDSALAFGISILTKRKWTGLATLGMSAFGQSMPEQLQGGSPYWKALIASLGKSGTEIATEFLPFTEMLKPNVRFMKRLGTIWAEESMGETANSLANDLIDKLTITPDMTYDQATRNVLKTLQVVALTSPAMAGMSHIVHTVVPRRLDPASEAAKVYTGTVTEALKAGRTPEEAASLGWQALLDQPGGKEAVEEALAELAEQAQSSLDTDLQAMEEESVKRREARIIELHDQIDKAESVEDLDAVEKNVYALFDEQVTPAEIGLEREVMEGAEEQVQGQERQEGRQEVEEPEPEPEPVPPGFQWLTIDHVRNAFKTQYVTPVAGGFRVILANGRTITVTPTSEILLDREAAEQAYGRALDPDERAVGTWQIIDRHGLITLTEEGIDELDHEVYHAAEAIVLTDEEISTLESTYGNEEARAVAYQDYVRRRKGQHGNIFRRILDFFKNVADWFRPHATGIFKAIESGEAWNRAARTRVAQPGSTIMRDTVHYALKLFAEGKDVDASKLTEAMLASRNIPEADIVAWMDAAREAGVSDDMIFHAAQSFADYNKIMDEGGAFLVIPEMPGGVVYVVFREGTMNTAAVDGIRRMRLADVYKAIAAGKARVIIQPLFEGGYGQVKINKTIRGKIPRVFLNIPITDVQLRRPKPEGLDVPVVVTGNPHLTDFRRPHPSWDEVIKVVRVKPVHRGSPAVHRAVISAMQYAREINAHILVTTFRARSMWAVACYTDIVPTDPSDPEFATYWRENPKPKPDDRRKLIDWEPYKPRVNKLIRQKFKEAGWTTYKDAHGEGGTWYWPVTKELDPEILEAVGPGPIEYCDLFYTGCMTCRNRQKLIYPEAAGAPVIGVSDEPFCGHGCPQCFVRLGQSGVRGRKGIRIEANRKQANAKGERLRQLYWNSTDILQKVAREDPTKVKYVSMFLKQSPADKLESIMSLFIDGAINHTEFAIMRKEIANEIGEGAATIPSATPNVSFALKKVRDAKARAREQQARARLVQAQVTSKERAETERMTEAQRKIVEDAQAQLKELARRMKEMYKSRNTEMMRATKLEVRRLKDVIAEQIYGRGQKPTLTEAQALRRSFQVAARAAREAMVQGKREEAAKWKAKMKEAVAKARAENKMRRMKAYLTSTKKMPSVAIEYQKMIRDILDGYDKTKLTEAKAEKLRAVRDMLKTSPILPPNISEKYVRELDRLDKVGSLSELSPQDLTELYKTVKHLEEMGRVLQQLRLATKEESRQKVLDHILNTTNNIDFHVALDRSGAMTKRTRVKAMAVQFYLDTLHALRVFDMADGYKNYQGPQCRLARLLIDRETTAIQRARSRELAFLEWLKENNIEIPTSESMLAMAIVIRHREGSFKAAETLMKAHGMTELPTLTETEEKIIQYFKDDMERTKPALAATWETLKNEIFPERDVYYLPLKYVREQELAPDVQTEGRGRTVHTFQGMGIERQPGVTDMPRTDLFNIYREAIMEQEWFLAMEPTITDIKSVVLTDDYERAAGNLLYQYWKDHIDIVARRGWSASAQLNAYNRAMQVVRNNLNDAILTWRLTTIMAQPFAVMDAMAFVGQKYGAKAAGKIFSEVAKAFIVPGRTEAIVAESEALRQRKGGELAIHEALEQHLGRSWRDRVAQAGYKAIIGTDIRTAAGVTKAVEDILREHGADEATAHQEAELVMRLTQGDASVAMRPHVLAKGEGWRTWFTFQSFILNRWGLIVHDVVISGLVKQKGIINKIYSLYALMFLMAAGASEDDARKALMRLLGSRKKDKGPEFFPVRAFLSLMSSMPIVGSMIQAAVFKTDAAPPVQRVAQTAVSGLYNTIYGKDSTVKGRGFLRFAEAVASLGGVPGTAQFIDMMENIFLTE